MDKLDYHFTNKEYKKHQTGRMIDIAGMVKGDSSLNSEIQSCYINSGKMALMSAEGFGKDYIARCIEAVHKSSEKTLDSNKVFKYCACKIDMIKTKKLTDAEMKALENPNSVLFYEVMSKCGNPNQTDGTKNTENWNGEAARDVAGPQSDTITILNMDAMTYLKAKLGKMVQVWLLDSGASDLLINKDMETELKEEGLLKASDYIGIGEYEMANGAIDTCRKYKMNNIQVGKFTINNVIVAVTDKGKRIIIGKALLNKFSNWILDNKLGVLVLAK